MKVYDDNIEQNFDIGYNVPYNVGYNDVKFCLLMLMAGQDPVVLPPSSPNPDNDLDDEHPMDEDELRDFSDQEPLPSPTL